MTDRDSGPWPLTEAERRLLAIADRANDYRPRHGRKKAEQERAEKRGEARR